MKRRKWDAKTKATVVLEGLQGKPVAAIPGKDFGSSEASPSVDSRVVFFDEAWKEELPEFRPDQVTLWLPLISGHFVGSPEHDFLLLQVGPDYRFTIELEQKEDLIRQLAAPLYAAEGLPELKISPPGVRIARLATFALDTKTEEGLRPTT